MWLPSDFNLLPWQPHNETTADGQRSSIRIEVPEMLLGNLGSIEFGVIFNDNNNLSC